MKEFIINLPEEKHTFSLKMTPRTKKLLREVCKLTNLDQEFIVRAGIAFVEREYHRKLKLSEKINSDDEDGS